ncbi:MAG TPA: DUF86 domain-containing protein [Desulfobaccales bacterium]
MPKDYRVYLDDIVEAIDKIHDYTKGLSLASFANDSKTIDAVNRNFGIIGEAANRIPNEIKAKHSNIEWHRINGLRNILIHDYSNVDLEVIWDIIENKLILFETQIKELYQE